MDRGSGWKAVASLLMFVSAIILAASVVVLGLAAAMSDSNGIMVGLHALGLSAALGGSGGTCWGIGYLKSRNTKEVERG